MFDIFTATKNIFLPLFHQHRDRPGLPVRVDPLRHRLRLQDQETTGNLQRDQVHLLHQHRDHHPLVRLRTTLSGEQLKIIIVNLIHLFGKLAVAVVQLVE